MGDEQHARRRSRAAAPRARRWRRGRGGWSARRAAARRAPRPARARARRASSCRPRARRRGASPSRSQAVERRLDALLPVQPSSASSASCRSCMRVEVAIVRGGMVIVAMQLRAPRRRLRRRRRTRSAPDRRSAPAARSAMRSALRAAAQRRRRLLDAREDLQQDDLPVPLRPIRPMRSPGSSTRSASSSSGDVAVGERDLRELEEGHCAVSWRGLEALDALEVRLELAPGARAIAAIVRKVARLDDERACACRRGRWAAIWISPATGCRPSIASLSCSFIAITPRPPLGSSFTSSSGKTSRRPSADSAATSFVSGERIDGVTCDSPSATDDELLAGALARDEAFHLRAQRVAAAGAEKHRRVVRRGDHARRWACPRSPPASSPARRRPCRPECRPRAR